MTNLLNRRFSMRSLPLTAGPFVSDVLLRSRRATGKLSGRHRDASGPKCGAGEPPCSLVGYAGRRGIGDLLVPDRKGVDRMSRDVRRWAVSALGGACCAALLTLPLAPRVVGQDDAATVSAPESETGAGMPPGDGEPLKATGSLLAKEPETPAELFDAVLLMLDLGKVDLAKLYLAKLVEAAPDDATLLELRDQFGPGAIARIARLQELRPQGAELADKINTASAAALADPARLAALVDQLGKDDANDQAVAFESLRNAGAIAVPGILAALNDEGRGGVHQQLLQILVEMGDVAVPPLLGALESPSSTMRSHAATALGYLKARSALPLLTYPAVGDDVPPGERAIAVVSVARILGVPSVQARDRLAAGPVNQLLADARAFLQGRQSLEADELGDIVSWGWDEAAGGVVKLDLPPEQANDRIAIRLARQAFLLSPERIDAQTMYLLSLLVQHASQSQATGALAKGPLSPTDIGLTVGPTLLSRTLRLALETRRGEAAVAALRLLGRTASSAEIGRDTSDSPILAALNAPDPRIQFAAARTILQIDPREQFPQSSRVVEILVRALAGEDVRKAVIVHPSGERGTQLAGQLGELGFNPLLVSTGKAAFRTAADRQDVSVVVIHANSVRWAASETVANLRADSRTAGIPILLVGGVAAKPALERLAGKYTQIAAVNEAQTSADIELQGKEFFRGLNREGLSNEERTTYRTEAAEWLRHLATTGRTRVFPIDRAEYRLQELLNEPDLILVAIDVLGEIPSEGSQAALARIVLDPTADPANRESAALTLAFHIQRFGLLLTTEQTKEVETAWANEQEPELRTALGTVVGVLKPDSALASERLKSAR